MIYHWLYAINIICTGTEHDKSLGMHMKIAVLINRIIHFLLGFYGLLNYSTSSGFSESLDGPYETASTNRRPDIFYHHGVKVKTIFIVELYFDLGFS